MLPTTFDENGCASARQHSCCLILDDKIALDAGSLAMAVNADQRETIRDVVLTHAHLDHIAGLPFFIDDLFASLQEPVTIHAIPEIIASLKNHIFNWEIFPKFDELKNNYGNVMNYQEIDSGEEFAVKGINFKSFKVNHKVPAVGYIITDGNKRIAVTGDTAPTEEIWQVLNNEQQIDVLFIECAFPDYLHELADSSHHLTPSLVEKEIKKFCHADCQIYAINLKPMYHDLIVKEIEAKNLKNLQIMEVGKVYTI